MGAALLVVAVLLGLAVLLLAVPVGLEFRLEGIEPFQGRFAVRWLFGLVRFRIEVPRPGKPSPRRKAKPKPPEEKKEANERGRRAHVLAALRRAEFRERVYRLLQDLLRVARLRDLRLRLRVGLGDPADTGLLWAALGPLGAMAQGLRSAEVRIEPDFLEPALDVQAQGRLRAIPLQLLALAVAFALSPPSIRAWRAARPAHA